MAIATEPRLMPHLHLSLQHGDDLLKRMKRRHLRDDAISFVKRTQIAPRHDFWCGYHCGLPNRNRSPF